MYIRGYKSPLFFKGFKGKFIYIGGALLLVLYFYVLLFLSGFFHVGRYNACNSYVWRLGITSQLQRKGLLRKINEKGIYIVSRTL